MVTEITYILKGVLIGICAAVPLGPVAMLVIQKTLTDGRKAGFSCGLGCSLADTIFAAISGFALYTVSQFLETHTKVIQIIGGVILLVVGMLMFFSRIREPEQRRAHSYDAMNFVKAMMMCLTNPGALAIMLGLYAFFHVDISLVSKFFRILTLVAVCAGSVSYWYVFSHLIAKLGYRFHFSILVMLNRVFGVIVTILGAGLMIKAFL